METGPKQHICHICGIAKSRKSDLKDHLSDVHHIGSPRVCNICKKKFKYKKGLKQHEKTQHEGKFKHNCEEDDCNFGTDGKQLFQTHRVRFHDESPPKKYQCKKCREIFDGQNLLTKHLKRGMCKVLKNYECTQCKVRNWFKTLEGLARHKQVYHTGDILKMKCHRCSKDLGSKPVMANHQKLHSGLEILARAVRLTRQKDDQFRKRREQVAASRSRIVVSQSAPAKLIQLGK